MKQSEMSSMSDKPALVASDGGNMIDRASTGHKSGLGVEQDPGIREWMENPAEV